MAILLDSNLFIAAERSKTGGRLEELIRQIPESRVGDEAVISVVTASELLMGLHRAVREDIRARRVAFVEAILDQFTPVPIDLRVAREHSRMAAELIASGQKIGTHDSWIAATGLSYGFPVVTTNVKEFGRVPGLEVFPISV